MSNAENDKLYERAREVVAETNDINIKQAIADALAKDDVEEVAWLLGVMTI